MSEKQYVLNNLAVCRKLANQAGDKSIHERIEQVYETYL
jgi:hypothetical protein